MADHFHLYAGFILEIGKIKDFSRQAFKIQVPDRVDEDTIRYTGEIVIPLQEEIPICIDEFTGFLEISQGFPNARVWDMPADK